MRWPEGVRSVGLHCGIKDQAAPDLGVIIGDEALSWAGVFTRNAAAAACVHYDRALLGRSVRAVVVNSGNANACTGAAGERAVAQVTDAAARAIGCSPNEVLMASTGPIGQLLPTDRIIAALPRSISEMTDDGEGFARAILTTDTRTKTAAAHAGDASVVGVAKGAAMLAPNMATMLAFIATDAAVDSGGLQDLLTPAVDTSFNRLVIDGCESTNDSVFLMASARVQNVEEDQLAKALQEVCSDLAYQIAADAEGATRIIRIVVRGTEDDRRAADLGRAVAGSALWRAAAFGADPNWGRVLAAMGAWDRSLDPRSVRLSLAGIDVFLQGEPTGALAEAAAAMNAPELAVQCTVGAGPGSAEILTTDLSPDYVTLNAYGTS